MRRGRPAGRFEKMKLKTELDMHGIGARVGVEFNSVEEIEKKSDPFTLGFCRNIGFINREKGIVDLLCNFEEYIKLTPPVQTL